MWHSIAVCFIYSVFGEDELSVLVGEKCLKDQAATRKPACEGCEGSACETERKIGLQRGQGARGGEERRAAVAS